MKKRYLAAALFLCAAPLLPSCSGSTEPPGPPESLTAVSVTPGNVAVGATPTDSLAVRVSDSSGKGVPNATVTWRVVAGYATVSPQQVVTDSRGVARALWKMGTRPAEEKVEASTVTVTGSTSVTFVTRAVPGPTATLRIIPGSVAMGVSTTRQLDGDARDEFGNRITGRSISWSSSDRAVAEVDGSGRVTALRPGTATVTASLDDRQAQAKVSVGTFMLEDDFDAENGGVERLSYTGFANWIVTRGSVDLLGNGSKHDFLPGNGLYVDLDGYYAGGRLESRDAFVLEPGTYTLQFDLAGSQRGDTNTVTVSLGSLYAEQITLTGSEPFRTYTRAITVPERTTARLVWDHQGRDGLGLLLDRVRLGRQ